VKRQLGFTLAEILIATAIAFTAGALLVRLVHATVSAAAGSDERLSARATVDRLEDRLAADATAAWSVFVPAHDVLGKSNADGHELDFASEDASHQTYRWGYGFDALASQVTAYTYPPGAPPSAGDVYRGIVSFAAETHPVTDLADPKSDVYDALFAADPLTAVDVPLPWGGNAVGGNHLIRLHVTAAGIDRTLLLSSGTAPSHFTVVVDYTPPPPTPTP
jgi:hypothetical protein